MNKHDLIWKHVEEPFFLFELRETNLSSKGIEFSVEINGKNSTCTLENDVAVSSLPKEDQMFIMLFASIRVKKNVAILLPKVAIEWKEELTSIVLFSLPDLELSITTFIGRFQIFGPAKGRSDNLSCGFRVCLSMWVEHASNVKLFLDLFRLCGRSGWCCLDGK